MVVVTGLPDYDTERQSSVVPGIAPFAGRLGGQQEYPDRNDPRNTKLLKEIPDAAPRMHLSEVFDLRGFFSLDLWKFALLECAGSMMCTFMSAWVTLHAPSKTESPQTQAGIYDTLTFFSPLFGGITNVLLTPLLIYTFSPSSGGHINPTITLATFFARMISFPRMVLYLGGQTFGGALAGFAMRTAYGSREFTVGGCYVDTEMVPVKDALVIEFMSCLVLVYVAFGVALDPRQASLFGYAASPWLVGLVLGIVSWGSAFTREGYIGASVNPARCFGVYVASSFPGYHWIHWAGPFAASISHGLIYYLDPLWVDPRPKNV